MWHVWKHFKTINYHKWLVFCHCCRAGIVWRGLVHDLSKYHFQEFIPGAKFYAGHHSPNVTERNLYGYSKAWLHHKGRNRHHLEYWVDYNPKLQRVAGIEMPIVFLIEMICDRLAASKVYLGAAYTDRSALEYFERSRHVSLIHPKTEILLAGALHYLANCGEKALFEWLRQLRKATKKAKKTNR